MQFCSGNLKEAAKIGIKHRRNEEFESETILEGRPISKGESIFMSDDML